MSPALHTFPWYLLSNLYLELTRDRSLWPQCPIHIASGRWALSHGTWVMFFSMMEMAKQFRPSCSLVWMHPIVLPLYFVRPPGHTSCGILHFSCFWHPHLWSGYLGLDSNPLLSIAFIIHFHSKSKIVKLSSALGAESAAIPGVYGQGVSWVIISPTNKTKTHGHLR